MTTRTKEDTMSGITQNLISARTSVQAAQDRAHDAAHECLSNGNREKYAKIEDIRNDLYDANRRLLALLEAE